VAWPLLTLAAVFVEAELLDAVIRGAVLSAAALLWVLVLSRVVGLRSFSKMTAFDFVATIATGSLLANAAVSTDWAAFVQPMTALLAVFAVQVVLAWLRQRFDRFRRAVDNRPHLLMWDGVIDEAALRRTRVARADVLAKLRDADAGRLDRVRAVVLEATGDISVLCADELDQDLIDDLENRPQRAQE
jgi:uncharacterized membrane protein YcaP (DUF421 family)